MSVADKGYQMSNYGLKTYTPDQVKEQWRENVCRENKIASNHKITTMASERKQQQDSIQPQSYYNNDKIQRSMSAYDQAFHIQEGYCNKLKRDDSQHTQGLDINGEERQKKVPLLSNSVYGHLPPLDIDQPTREHVRVAVVKREFYRNCGINVLPSS